MANAIKEPKNPAFANRPKYITRKRNPDNWEKSDIKSKIRKLFLDTILPTIPSVNGMKDRKEIIKKWKEYLTECLKKNEISQWQHDSWKSMMND